jgi:hypothetical protein
VKEISSMRTSFVAVALLALLCTTALRAWPDEPPGPPAGAPQAPAAEPAKGPKAFATPEAAMQALFDALAANDDEALIALTGPGSDDIVQSGKDPVVADQRAHVAALGKVALDFTELDDGTKVAYLGTTRWPMPIPLVKRTEGWVFDAESARDEILARRIGTNELRVMELCRDVVAAQEAYKKVDRDGDGVLEYTARLLSSEGKTDGLWWPPTPGESEATRSPLGAVLDEALRNPSDANRPVEGGGFSGYRWKLLTAQGPSAPGGAQSWLEGENLTKGFGLLAVPIEHGKTGIMSFMISHRGRMFDRNLGAKGLDVHKEMTVFEPDTNWFIVTEEELETGARPNVPAGGQPAGKAPDCPPAR